MDLIGVNRCTSIYLLLFTLLMGCASKTELEQRQTQLFQTGIDQSLSATKNDTSIVVKTQKGMVAITPTVVGYAPKQIEDPLESINRPIFAFNHGLYTWVLTPLARGYAAIMPDPAEVAVSQFFSNLREPLNAFNHILQANGSKSGASLGRFLINSTIGILGLFDPASEWFDIKPHKATLNDTLRSWDVSAGPYIVIPILGQSDVRNGFSTFTETTFAPVTFITDQPQTLYIQTYDGFHEFSPRAESYETLYNESEDPYVFFRNMYMQSVLRNQEFQNQESQLKTTAEQQSKLND